MLLRDGINGLEVFLVRRHEAIAFMGGAHVFPGGRVAKLSDYVALMKGMQTGDMMGALSRAGLDMSSYMAVATQWGQKLATDATLNAKFAQMMSV